MHSRSVETSAGAVQVALTVVMAAKGYPGAYAKGSVMSGLDNVSTAKVWGALAFKRLPVILTCVHHVFVLG